MEKLDIIHTSSEDFTDKYYGDYFDYYQLHIYSVPQIISHYYSPEHYTAEAVKEKADRLLNQIKDNSGSRAPKITMFEKNGKFLISCNPDLFDEGELLSFNKSHKIFEYDFDLDISDIDVFLEGQKVDSFIKKGVISIGASDLFEVLEPIAQKKRAASDKHLEYNEQTRKLNLSDPKFNLEIYRIEKDYKPVLVNTFPLHSPASMYLPEYSSLIQSGDRITFLLKEIASGKIIEGNLNEDIEGLKQSKWMKNHPSVIDAEAMHRMHLDDDDPDFLSWNDYIDNDEEAEEGDEDYHPHF